MLCIESGKVMYMETQDNADAGLRKIDTMCYSNSEGQVASLENTVTPFQVVTFRLIVMGVWERKLADRRGAGQSLTGDGWMLVREILVGF